MKKTYIPTLQERRVEAYFTEKYGSDNTLHFGKLQEEYEELVHAFLHESEERVNEELSDLITVIVHFARRRGLTIEQMLDMALEKAKIRETNPEYKRDELSALVDFPKQDKRKNLNIVSVKSGNKKIQNGLGV